MVTVLLTVDLLSLLIQLCGQNALEESQRPESAVAADRHCVRKGVHVSNRVLLVLFAFSGGKRAGLQLSLPAGVPV